MKDGAFYGRVCVNLDDFHIELRDGVHFSLAFWNFYTRCGVFFRLGLGMVPPARERYVSHLTSRHHACGEL